MSHTWPDVLSTLVAGDDLTTEQARWAMDEVFAGAATPVQLTGLVVALRAKGETVDEVTGIADAMLAAANPISVPGRLLDVVGTGGDRSMSVNISTMSAIVAAGAGARVVKHGNRSASSKSGSADVLEALGIRLDLPPARVAEVADEAGITFCFSAALPPGDAPRGRAAPRARHRHDVQHPRSADQPGPARRRRPSGAPTPGWRRSWPACWPPAASTRGSSAATTASTS